MPVVLPDNTHIDDSLAKGVARQIIRDAIADMERRHDSFNKKMTRLTSLPRKPGKRLDMLVRYFSGLLGNSLICEVRNPGQKNVSLLFSLDYRRHHQVSDAPPVLEVIVLPVSANMADAKKFHAGIRVSLHVLERIIQRNGARSIKDVSENLKLPVLHLYFQYRKGSLALREGEIITVPAPDGLLICGADGSQPYNNISLITIITFIHASQMTEEQLGQWHFYKSTMPDDIACLYPNHPGDLLSKKAH